MLLISAFLSEISATSASGFFMDHAESMGSGRQQWTSDILEWLRNQDERRPLLPTQEPVARLGNWKGHRVGTMDILSHCRRPFNTSILEGINNKIKVLKRIAYGYRDEAYFYLKIRAAFPGNP